MPKCVAENFLPKIDGSTITLAHLLQHMKSSGVQAMLLGPESGMTEYAGCRLFGTFGVPLRVYPGLKINFISPAFIRAIREFRPDVIHLVDPIWLGVQALAAVHVLFPSTPVVTSHHTNLPTYASVFGYPYHHHRTWQIHAYLHSFAKYTLVPSASTAGLLTEKGFGNLRVCSRGVDPVLFNPSLRSEKTRLAWGVLPSDVVILSVGRLSPEKNLSLLVEAFAILPPMIRRRAKLVFVGEGPFAIELKRLCLRRGVEAVFTGQLTGVALGEAFASADVMSSPSITETFGQVTLQGMASGLPVVGLYVEGTADLVSHGRTGLLLDVHAAAGAFAASPFSAGASHSGGKSYTYEQGYGKPSTAKGKHNGEEYSNKPWAPLRPLDPGARVACFRDAAHLMQPPSSSSSSFYPTSSFFTSATEPAALTLWSPTTPTTGGAFAAIAGRYACLLETLVAEEELRAEMGRAAWEASRMYVWERCAERVVETYVAACGGAKSVVAGSQSTTAIPRLSSSAFSTTGALVRVTLAPKKAWILQPVVDAFVVVHALVAATLSHASYMVPTAADVLGRV
ncbi:hypothetical protein C8R43DRAFT_587058 [Mycena crocata]|nr:hypothetical protein C8R43DRAFT_587058 [Mycena crocata]